MKWISVKKKLPSEHEKILIFGKFFHINFRNEKVFDEQYPVIIIGIYKKKHNLFFSIDEFDSNIEATHWMELPKPPSKEKEN